MNEDIKQKEEKENTFLGPKILGFQGGNNLVHGVRVSYRRHFFRLFDDLLLFIYSFAYLNSSDKTHLM